MLAGTAVPVRGIAEIALDTMQVAVNLAGQVVAVHLHHGMRRFPISSLGQIQHFFVITLHVFTLLQIQARRMRKDIPRIAHAARRLSRSFTLAALMVLKGGSVLAATGFEYIGQQIIPNGTKFGGHSVGGLSSIDYDAVGRRYFLVSDDRSNARFYTLRLDLDKFERSDMETAGMGGVVIESVQLLKRSDGKPHARNEADAEAMRLAPSRLALFWTDEGRRSLFGFRAPAVIESALNGDLVRTLPLPAYYLPQGSARGTASGDSGIAANLSLESLSLSPDGNTLWTATENGLVQDSVEAGVRQASLARLLSFNLGTGKPAAEYIYPVEPVALPPIMRGLYSTNGLTDMIAIGPQQFIMLERSFAIGAATPGKRQTGMSIRIFYADASRATNVAGMASIAGKAVRAVEKTLLLDLSQLVNDDGTALVTDNIEGMTLGPCHKGKPTLLLVSDNNFSLLQFTQIVALSLHDPLPVALPACTPPR